MTGSDKASPKISPLVPPLETARVPTEPFLPTAPVRTLEAESNELELTIRNKDGSRYIHPLTKNAVTVGRRPDNDIVLPDRCVSGHHAEFQRLRSGEYELVDHGSYNGTTVNGHRIDRVKLKAGDTVEFGSFKVEIVPAHPVLRAARSGGQSDEDFQRLQAERDKLQRERDSYVSVIAQLKSDQCRAEKAAEVVRGELNHDQQQLAMIRKELAESRAALESTRAEINNARSARGGMFGAAETDAQLRARQAELAEVENALARARENEKRLSVVATDLSKKEQEYKSFVLQLSNLRAERDRLLDEVQRMRSSGAGNNTIPKAPKLDENGRLPDGALVKQREILLTIEEDTRKARAELDFTKQNLEAFQFRRDEIRHEVQRHEETLKRLTEHLANAHAERERLATDAEELGFRAGSFFLPPTVGEAPKANSQPAVVNHGGNGHGGYNNGSNGHTPVPAARPVAMNAAHGTPVDAPMASPLRPKLEPRIAV